MSNYECPYCGADLVYEDTYGQGAYWKQDDKPTGDIYRCPNHEGFETEDVALDYLSDCGMTLRSNTFDYQLWEDVVCESSGHNVSGSFYTDEQGDLFEGYPC